MPGCCAVGCSNSDGKGFQMKRFPRNPEQRKLWEIAVNRENWQAKDSTFLCEAHFLPEMFEQRRLDGKVKLKPNAVPTIFSDVPTKTVRKPRVKRIPKKEKTEEQTITDTDDRDIDPIFPLEEMDSIELDESLHSIDSHRKYFTDVKLKYLEEEHELKMNILSIENETAEINNETAKIEYEMKKIDHEIKKIELNKKRRELEKTQIFF